MTDGELKSLFQIIDDNLNAAYEANDSHTIASLLADDWIMIEPQFGIINKKRFLEVIESGKLSHQAMKKKVLLVNLHDDMAIVISRGKNTGHYLNKSFDAERWITNIYKKRSAGWICIMTQEAPVSCDTP